MVKKFKIKKRRGIQMILVIVLVGLMAAIGLAALSTIQTEANKTSRLIRQQQIYSIAEAGVNYYRWHLAHYPDDYQDGTAAAGPYIHDFKDSTGNVIGRYELTITPPASGNTIVTVQSTGYLISSQNTRKTIIARLGMPSLTKYAVVSASNLRFGEGTEIFGPVHSNGGIRFDGIAHGLVTSAQSTYDDPDHTGAEEPGVHTHQSNASAVFLGGTQYPVAPIDFNGITADLATLKTKASSASGFYLGASGAQGYHVIVKADGKMDVYIVNSQLRCQFRSGSGTCSNNSSRTCTGVNTGCSGSGTCLNWHDYGFCQNDFNHTCTSDSDCRVCSSDSAIFCSTNQTCSSQSAGSCNVTVAGSCIKSSFSIGTASGSETPAIFQGASATNISFPANGIIFFGDDVWVDGQIDHARLTIVAARDPLASGEASIYVNKDLRYTHYDGTDAIGLIAQNNILVGFFSEDNLRIDAAMIAQNGRIGRAYYGSSFTSSTNSQNFSLYPSGSTLPSGGASETSCQQFRKRSVLTTNGSLATNQRYGFAWVGSTFSCGTDSNDSGYCDRNLNFDQNMTYAPPPEFPSTGQYQIISFDEQ